MNKLSIPQKTLALLVVIAGWLAAQYATQHPARPTQSPTLPIVGDSAGDRGELALRFGERLLPYDPVTRFEMERDLAVLGAPRDGGDHRAADEDAGANGGDSDGAHGDGERSGADHDAVAGTDHAGAGAGAGHAGRSDAGHGGSVAETTSEYLAHRLSEVGLEQVGGHFEHTFEAPLEVDVDQATTLEMRVRAAAFPLVLGSDWRPARVSANGRVAGEVVFCGYGTASHEVERNHYAGVDVDDRVALVFFQGHENEIYSKAVVAAAQGARGLIVLHRDAESLAVDRIYTAARAPIPVVEVAGSSVAPMLGAVRANLEIARDLIDKTGGSRSFPIDGLAARFKVSMTPVERSSTNVYGWLSGGRVGADPIVVAATFEDRRLDAPATSGDGAADGTGVAALLQVAEALASRRDVLERPVLFLAFASAGGLSLGATHFAVDPAYPTDRMAFAVAVGALGRHGLAMPVSGPLLGRNRGVIDEGAATLGLTIDERRGLVPGFHQELLADDVPALAVGDPMDVGASDAHHTDSEAVIREARFVAWLVESLASGARALPERVL